MPLSLTQGSSGKSHFDVDAFSVEHCVIYFCTKLSMELIAAVIFTAINRIKGLKHLSL